jgi:mutator protein MutT
MKTITTTLVFLLRPGEIMLAMKKRGHGEGNWNGVGGKVEPGETIEQAMVRECQEEISVTPTTYAKVAQHVFHQPYRGEPCKNTVHTYVCTAWTGELAESEEMAPAWFSLSAIPYDRMWPDDRHWMPDMLAGKLLETCFYYDDDNVLQSYDITEVAGWS